jgi:hypothetical protein
MSDTKQANPPCPSSVEEAYQHLLTCCPCVLTHSACGPLVCKCNAPRIYAQTTTDGTKRPLVLPEGISECLDGFHAALDALIRAVLAERGHVAGCGCINTPSQGVWSGTRHDDPRCAPPAWPPVKP